MNRGLAIGGLVLVAGAGAAWAALGLWRPDPSPARAPAVSAAVPDAAGAPSPIASDEVRIDEQDAPVDSGITPMAQRVAVIGLLNKRNGVSRDLTMKPGQALRVGDVIVRLRACEQTAPWEVEQLTGAFLQLDVRAVDTGWRRAFSGWVYKERPALNVVLHPIYDVWTKSCAMTFPGTAPSPAPSASSAKKSPAPAPAPAATAPAEGTDATEDNAAPSNAI